MSNFSNKEHVFRTLQTKFPQETEKNLREVSYNLCTAGVQTEASLFTLAEKSFEKLKRFAPMSVLSEQAKQIAVQSNQNALCPVCKVPMKLVNLLEGVKANYCSTHKIAEPLPVEQGV